MAQKLTTAMATVYAATIAGFTTIYTNHKKLEANKELAILNHNLELKRMNTSSNTPLVTDQSVLQKDSLNDSLGPVTKALMESENSLTQQPMLSGQTSKFELKSFDTKLDESGSLNSANNAGFDFNDFFESYLEQNTLQLACVSFFLYDVAILMCLIGLIVNHYVKLYGDKYMDKLPNWSLSLVRYYLKLGQLSNNYYMILILFSLLCSMSFCVMFYFMDLA
jgi:hypothetical protein